MLTPEEIDLIAFQSHGNEAKAIRQLQRQLAEATKWERAVDEELIVRHLGTTDSFESPKKAMQALSQYDYDLGVYFAKQEAQEVEQT